jgi:pyruvate dehydrogenase E2 component (dihydrolipoamide acetyltransferase)
MAEAIIMPKLGFDMAEGTLVSWTKKVGDQVNSGDVIAEIETDKATVEVEAYVSGTILALLAEPGDVLAVGSVIGWVGEPGEKVPEGEAAAATPSEGEAERRSTDGTAATETEERAARPEPTPAGATPSSGNGHLPGGVKASPLARKIASERGIDLRQVKGTGPGGRIVKADVERFEPAAAPAPAATAIPAPTFGELPSGPDVEISDTSNLRRRIGARMVESKQQVPHFYVTTSVDVEALLKLREQINAAVTDDAEKVTVNDLIVKATALTLRQFPNLNSHFYGDKIVHHKRIHIGIAVALPQGGLITAVARDADKTALSTLAARNKEMIARAREGKVRPDDVEGSTFTVSNLGAFDVDHFIAIINPPEAGILAVGSAQRVPIVREDGSLGVGNRMKVTVSVDHRVSDGAEAAQFLQTFKALVENPMRLLI